MKKKFDVATLCMEATRNPAVAQCRVLDWENGNEPITPERQSPRTAALLEFFKPILDAVSWSVEGMDPRYQKAFEHSAKVAACHAMAVRIIGPGAGSGGMAQLKKEATTAGLDVPTFTRQLLLTITRAYAQLFSLQLFGTIPLNGPTGRIMFKDYQYDSAFTGSTPFINVGDRDDDLTKLNPDYDLIPEGQQANKGKLHWSNMDISTFDTREATEWTDQAADDSAAIYGEDLQGDIMTHLSQMAARNTDRRMIAALINAVPSANQYTWTGSPVSNPNSATLSPSERSAYDEMLYRDAINTTLNKIGITRKGNNDGQPTWAICGPNFALRLGKLSAAYFQPKGGLTEIEMQRGALRDLGTMEVLGLRILVDYMLPYSISGGTDMCFFGRKPMQRGDVGLYLAPYVMLQPTRELYDPETGKTVQAVRSRYGIVQPNTGLNPASSQLGEIYGQLTVSSGGAGA